MHLKKNSFTMEEIDDVNNLFELNKGISSKILKKYDEDKNSIKVKVEFSNEFGIKMIKEYTINIIDDSENMKLDESLNRKLKQTEFSIGDLSKFSQLFDLSDGASAVVKEKIDVSKPGKKTFNVRFTKDGKYFEREYSLNIVEKGTELKPTPEPTPEPKPNSGSGINSGSYSGGGTFAESSNNIKKEKTENKVVDNGVFSKLIKSLGINQERFWGKTRIQTAIEISKNSYKSTENVILVSDKSNADALASSLFAKEKNAPILLTNNKKLSIDVENEINRLGVKNIYIVGGERSVSDDVYRTLKDKGFNVYRISGKDRYETSEKLLGMVHTNMDNIFIVNGTSEPDAVSVSPVSAINNTPVILVNGKNINSKTVKLIEKYKNKTIIGGVNRINKKYEEIIGADRISGNDRFDTSMKIKDKYLKDSKNIIISSGKAYVDALVGSVYAAKNNSPIILVDSDNISESIKSTIEKADKVTILGGTNSIK